MPCSSRNRRRNSLCGVSTPSSATESNGCPWTFLRNGERFTRLPWPTTLPITMSARSVTASRAGARARPARGSRRCRRRRRSRRGRSRGRRCAAARASPSWGCARRARAGALRQRVQAGGRAVGGAVVDEDQLELLRRQRLAEQGAQQVVDVRARVVDRDDDADLGHRQGSVVPWPPLMASPSRRLRPGPRPGEASTGCAGGPARSLLVRTPGSSRGRGREGLHPARERVGDGRARSARRSTSPATSPTITRSRSSRPTGDATIRTSRSTRG